MTLEVIGVLPDTHAPFHDQRAWRLTMKVMRWLRPKQIVHLGDWQDFYAVSAHSKDPRRALDLEYEIKEGRKLIRQVANIAPTIYCAGNHEARLSRFINDKAPELHELVTTENLLELGKMEVRYIPYRTSYRIGCMRFTHDVNGKAGKNAVVGSLEAMGHNVCIGHIHRISYHVNGDLEGERHVGISVGWLGDLRAIDYMHRDTVTKDWALGFGIAHHDPSTGYVSIQAVPIMPNYSVVVYGKSFSEPAEV